MNSTLPKKEACWVTGTSAIEAWRYNAGRDRGRGASQRVRRTRPRQSSQKTSKAPQDVPWRGQHPDIYAQRKQWWIGEFQQHQEIKPCFGLPSPAPPNPLLRRFTVTSRAQGKNKEGEDKTSPALSSRSDLSQHELNGRLKFLFRQNCNVTPIWVFTNEAWLF